MRRKNHVILLNWIAFIVVSIFVFFPFFWGLRTSLVPQDDFHFVPKKLTLEHYIALLQRPEFLVYVKNSLLVSLSTIFITLIIALPGGYALARFKFPGHQLGIILLVLPLLPPIAILVPLLSYFRTLKLHDTLMAVIIANVIFNLPFAVWMLRNFILVNPVEIEEAAQLDGCSRFEILVRIAIPMMIPGLIAVSIFIFINAWNNYLYAFALISSQDLRVLPQGILSFLGTWGTYWGGLTATGILAIIPPIILFLIFQRWFIKGIFTQGLK